MKGDVCDYDDSDQVIRVKYGADEPHLGYAAASKPSSTAAWTHDAAGNRAEIGELIYSYSQMGAGAYMLASGDPLCSAVLAAGFY